MAPHTPARRNAGLRRVSRATRWTLASAVGLTVGFGSLAARSFSGAKHKTQNVSTSTNSSSSSSTTSRSSEHENEGDDDNSTSSTNQLQSPATAPSTTAGSGNVTSGGS